MFRRTLKKWRSQIKNGQSSEQTLSKEDIQMAMSIQKIFHQPYIIMDLQTKTTLRYYYKPIRMAKVSNTSKLKSWYSHSLQMGRQNGLGTL